MFILLIGTSISDRKKKLSKLHSTPNRRRGYHILFLSCITQVLAGQGIYVTRVSPELGPGRDKGDLVKEGNGALRPRMEECYMV
jgi:hypothetical protein